MQVTDAARWAGRLAAGAALAALFVTEFFLAAPTPAAGAETAPRGRSLEHDVRSATLVVCGRIETPPVRAGDVYELVVTRTLRGEAPGEKVPVRATPDDGAHRQAGAGGPAREARLHDVLAFLTAGDHAVYEVVALDDMLVPAPFTGGPRPWTEALDAVQALAALNAEKLEAAEAATAWAEGLRSRNRFLAAALLERVTVVCSPGAADVPGAGDAAFVARARRDVLAAPDALRAALLAVASAGESAARCRGFAAAELLQTTFGPEGVFGTSADVVETASTALRNGDARVREAALRLLVVVDRDGAAAEIVTRLANPRADDADRRAVLGPARLFLTGRWKEHRSVVAALVEATDGTAPGAVMACLGDVVGVRHRSPADWKKWLAQTKFE